MTYITRPPTRGILRNRVSPWLVLFLMILGTTMPLVDTTIMNVGRYWFVRAFDVPTYETGWLTAGYSLALAMGIPLSHRLRGFFEERNMYAITTWAFLTGTLVVMSSTTLAEAMIGRAIEGLSGGILLPLSITLIRESFPQEKVPLAISLFTLANALAVSLGPTLGGYLLYAWGWRSAFFVNLPVGFLTIILSQILLVNHPRQDPKRFDLPGFFLLCLASGTFFWAFMAAEWFGWHSFSIDLAFGISLIALFLYALWSAFFPDPILPLDLLVRPKFLLTLALVFLVSTSVFGRLYLLAPFLERNYHFQPYQAGEIIAIGAFSEILTAFLVFSDILERVNTRIIFLAACGCLALSNIAYLRLPQNVYSAPMISIPQILFGFGLALSQFSLVRLIGQSLPQELSRIGGVYQQTVQFLGGMFGTVLCRHLLNNIPPVFFLALPQTSPPAVSSVDLQKIASLAYAFGYNMIFEWLGLFPLAAVCLVLADLLFRGFFTRPPKNSPIVSR
ncbi:MAG: MFS transporter [Nitrospiraceae bacterium]|nr:MFS transporter [Nitrospiraceae bacterium]